MALGDFILKAKVNVALVRDSRVSVFDIGVRADNGVVTLTGDMDTAAECRAAEEIVRGIEGVGSVRNEITCGMGKRADTAARVTQRFLEKLDEEWNNLRDKSALAQADYLRWALWMVYKFKIPQAIGDDKSGDVETKAIEQALTAIAGYVGAPKALVALEMLRQAEEVAVSPRQDAPALENAPLIATPVAEGANAA